MAFIRFRHCSLLLVAAACATTPITPPEAEVALTAAEAQVTAEQFTNAEDTLAPLAGEDCPKRLRDRRDLALARARVGNGRLWDAYRVLETFPDSYPHSDLRPTVVELVWQIGQELVRSDRGFLFFWSDRRAGRTVLEHLVTRYPETPRLADALKVLGDLSFADGEYELAQQRFRDLMLNRPESEWVAYAQYQFAMCIVASLEGPDYDLERMEQATRELRDFLDSKPENPELVANANAAMQRVTEWRVERHLRIAAFYHQVGSVAGERHHLELATDPQFANAEGYADAVAKRQRFEQAMAAKPAAGGP